VKTYHKIITGDSRDMSLVQDESIHLIITSPPYWQLKDYGTESQIGFNDSYEGYINNLNLVWSECFRVLHKGCRLCINIGDQFARSVYYGRYKVIPIREEIIKFCEILGFDYMGAVIWQKVTNSNTTGGGVQMGSYPYPRNGILKLDYEFILIFKKLGDAPKPTLEQKQLSKMTNEEWNTYFAGHWKFSGVKQSDHIAMFPEELPKRLIKMFSFVGENILDPFGGSGTTSYVAKKLDRNSILFEINPDYREIISSKMQSERMDIYESAVEFFESNSSLNFQEKIFSQPYIFSDPHKFDKKVDVKKFRFGSKIDSHSDSIREDSFLVKEALSPESLKLENGLIIRLLGVSTKPDSKESALRFLSELAKGKRVYIKYDDVKFDHDGNLLGYVYLLNKTFLNAHLIKRNLVDVDCNKNYAYKTRFMKLHSDAIEESHANLVNGERV